MDPGVLRIDRADVREEDGALTVILGAGGVHVLLIRLRYDGWADEVVNAAGTVGPGPGAWTLIGRELTLELDRGTAAALGLPRDCRLRLDVDEGTIGRVRTALLEILDTACHVVDGAQDGTN